MKWDLSATRAAALVLFVMSAIFGMGWLFAVISLSIRGEPIPDAMMTAFPVAVTGFVTGFVVLARADKSEKGKGTDE